MALSTSTAVPSGFRVASDLSQLCLPQEYQDGNRRLAWANSICCLFLAVGLVGLNPPPVVLKALSEIPASMPIELPPPEEVKPPEPTEPQPDPEPTTESTPDTPVVAIVVAADPSAAAFAVPVEGPVVLAPTRFAAPPPRNLKPPPRTRSAALAASEAQWSPGFKRVYPPVAERNRYQGTVLLELSFDATGALTSAKVLKSSGYSVLDNDALHMVQNYLRLKNPPGEPRVHTLEWVYKLP